jgi:hypothetical protein
LMGVNKIPSETNQTKQENNEQFEGAVDIRQDTHQRVLGLRGLLVVH